ncbi:MAG TPA: hypothetical protein PKX87_02520 [Alphaproteobacteria bacterium]|nr:hypothetical protein [Alphaproteobacteria bacterium]
MASEEKKLKRRELREKTSEYFNAIARGLHDLSSEALKRGAGEYLLSGLYDQAQGDKQSRKALKAALENVVNGHSFQKTPPREIDRTIGKDGKERIWEMPGSRFENPHPLVKKAVLDFARTRGIKLKALLGFVLTAVDNQRDSSCLLPGERCGDRRPYESRQKDRSELFHAFLDYDKQ